MMTEDIVGKLVADKYRIEALIRESESGDLFRGRHEILDKPVTVKILSGALAIDNRWVTRFVSEARAASAVSHPNILNITDFGTDAKGVSYAVFEAIEGETLRDVLSTPLRLAEGRAVSIARQIADAIAAAHAKKIIHGRLTTEDVFIAAEEPETVKVYGFGSDPMSVARDADPRYLAPEQCTSHPVADERSDVYALGVMLYEMLSGGVPYEGATIVEIVAKQNSEPPAPLSAFRNDLHADIEPIVLSAMAADPDRRYQKMSAFAEDLNMFAGGAAEAAKAAAATATPTRNAWQTAFIVLAGVSLLAVALIYATSVKRTDPTTQLEADTGSLPVQPIGPATGAQEESLAKLPAMTDAEIMASANASMNQPPGTLPGGDGYNAWANGGAPPPGAPLNQNVPPVGYVPPGGQVYTIDPNGGSQFMPPEGGIVLVPVPANTNPGAKPSPSPKNPAANTAGQPTPLPGSTPKPMATPPPRTTDKPATTKQPPKEPAPAVKPPASGAPSDQH